MTLKPYVIIGRRPTGETLHYVSDMNGSRFVPNAYSLAATFGTLGEAIPTRYLLRTQFKGLAISVVRKHLT